MNRKSLFGRFAAPISARRTAQRPEHRRAQLEPLEDRKLLAIINVDDNWRLTASPIGTTVTLTFGAAVISSQNASPNNNRTGFYGINAFGTVQNGTSELTGAHFLTVADDIDGIENDTRYIQDAINRAANDDTVNVLPGTYTESDIVVNKPLKLRGSGLSGTTDTLLVPEVASARAEQEFPENSHQGIIIYAPSVTVSLFRLDGSGNAGLGSTFNYHQGITTLYDQQNPAAYHDYIPTRGRAALPPIQLGPSLTPANGTTENNPNKSRPFLVIKDVKVENAWYHGITLSAKSGQHFDVGGTNDDFLQNMVYNAVVNNIGDAANRGANHIGVLLQNITDHPDADITPTATNTNALPTGTGITVSNVGIGIVGRAFASDTSPSGYFGSFTYDNDGGAHVRVTISNVTINSAQVEGIRLHNNDGGDGTVSNVLNFDPGNSAIGIHYIHSENLPLANTTINNAFIGIKIENSDTQTKVGTPGGNTNPNGRNAVPVFEVGLKVIGPSLAAGSVGILADNGGAFGGVNTDAGFLMGLGVEVTGYATGVKILQTLASNRSTFVAVDRPNIHGNTIGFNIGTGVIIQGKIDTPDPFVNNSLLSPAYYPNLVENYADQLDDQPVPPTQPIAASVEPPPPLISVESKPRPVTITSGNLTLGAGTTYNPILNGTAGSQSLILEDFSTPRTLGTGDVVSEDQVNPWQVNFVDDDPNQPVYYKSPGVLGLWDPAGITQNGGGTVIIETGSPVGALFDAQATAPLDVSGYNNVRLIARRGPDFANGVKQIALGIVDQDGTVDVYFFPTKTLEDQWAINPSTWVTFEVNLLTPPIRFTDGDGIMNLSAITGWAAAGDLAFTDFKTANPLSIEIDSIGFTKGPAASQFDVTGTVALGAGVAVLDPVSGGNFVSSVGQQFKIINNDGTDAVTGTFKDTAGNNLPQGAFFTAHGKHFQISYTGGDGNDVVLTEVSANSVPVLDLDVANGASTGRSSSWTFGGGAVNLTNTDAIVADADDSTLDQMTAELSPAQPHLQQVISLSGAPAGGNFTLTYNGKTTAPIPYNATAADVDAALEALSTIGAGNVTVVTDPNAQYVTGSAGGPWTVTFGGSLNLTTLQKIKGDSQQLPRRIVALRGAPTGGYFTLTYHGQVTSNIAWNASATDVQNALQALTTIGSGNALVTGSAGGPWTVQFLPGIGGPLALTTLDSLIPTSFIPGLVPIPTLTGGTSPRADVVDVDALSGGVGPLVRVLDGGVHPNDVLAATAVGNISVVYNSTSGVLKMSGTDTKANYQTVLRSITYNSSAHPAAATRTVLITANDGLSDSNVTIATVSITANSVPVLDLDGPGGTNNFAVTLTHTAVPGVIVDTDATVTDSDNANMSSAAARVTATHPHISQLVKVTGIPTGGTFTLRYAGQTTADIPFNATPAAVKSALEALSKIGAGNATVTSPNATGGPWTVVFGGGLDTTKLSQLTVNFTNADGTNQLTGGTAPKVSASDSQPHMTQTVTVTGASGGTFTLTFLGQTTTPIAFNALASAVQTALTSLINVGGPNVLVTGSAGGPYTVVFGSNTSTIDMTQLGKLIPNGASLVGGSVAVTEAEAGVEVYPGDQLFLATPSGLSQSYNSTTGVLTISGTASKATYEAALRSLNYYSTAVSTPAASRLVKISVKDQGFGETIDPYSTINLIANELPVADLNGDATAGTGLTVTWSRVSGPVSLANPSFATVHDSDDTTLVSMRVTLSSLHAGDVLAATASGLISVSYNSGNGVLLMTGTDTLANYQTVLRTLTYNNTSGVSPPVPNKLVFVSGDDGKGTALNSFDTIVITANQKPLLDLDAGGPTGHTSKWLTPTPVNIADATGASIFDPDDSIMSGLTATITSFGAGDVLAFTVPGGSGITASYNAANGVLTATGNGSVANYQSLLRSITYNNTVGVPAALSRIINVVVKDSLGLAGDTQVAQVFLNQAPTLDLDGAAPTNYSTSWNNTGAVNITDSLGASIIDTDDGKMASMTATLTTLHAGDVLGFTPVAGITASYNAGNGVLTATGTVSKILYRALLRSITYNNTVGIPPVGSKVVNFKGVDPNGGQGTISTSTITIVGGGGNSTVVARKIFYNQSNYDGTTAASGLAINFFSDNLAIATDKTAYLPGDPKAVAFNITNYTRGINGIIIDLSTTGGVHQSITAADFVFKVGNNNTPSSWAAAPATASVAVSLGFGGNDRVEITWAANAITNKWLEVQMLANSRTGLAATDVFFFGNKIADSASGALDNNNFVTNSTDSTQVFATLTPTNGAAITNVRDYNRDKTVNSTDSVIVFTQLGNLNRLLVGSAGPFAPDGGDLGGGGGGDAGISSALAGGGGGSASGSAGQALPTAVVERLEGGGGGGGSAAIDAALASSLADDDAADDDGADEMDELLDSLAAGA